jgi:3'(2'), 5'-bisphosphate nucleotidase
MNMHMGQQSMEAAAGRIDAQQALSAACDAVVFACRVTRAVQNRLEQIGEITKDDRSPVTVADFASQAVIAHHLQAAVVPAGARLDMVGEESTSLLRQAEQSGALAEVVAAVRAVWPEAREDQVLEAIDAGGHDASAPSYWTLDPIDGTKGFLRRGQYAIALAYIEAGRVKLGVMGCPNLPADLSKSFDDADPEGMLYFASAGAGAFGAPANRSSVAARVRASDAPHDGAIRVCESVETSHTKQDDTARIIALLGGGGEPARLDSQCKYAVVARGQADAYLRLPTKKGYVEKIWDHAAGMIIAQEAGAIVTDIDGKPLDFSRGAGLSGNRGVVCANSGWHGRIIQAIRSLGIGAP